MGKKKIANKKEVRAWKDRRELRFNEENKVVIEWLQHKDLRHSNKILAFTQDLSIGGAKILTDINFPVDTIFMINLTLSRSRQNVRVAANVRWATPFIDGDLYEVGLEFIHDCPDTVSCLLRHLYGKDFPQDVALEMNEEEKHPVQLAAR
ncbi:MAG: PilZ domain-containing protein [Candidatus Aminicenantes bacterium]|nr:PilZ domain-containing protein [Candidatus Aminicenantes bacterium]